jgi:hypothetical protein
MEEKMMIYVSGKMGQKRLSRKTVRKFFEAAERLRSYGWEVTDPACKEFQADLRAEMRNTEKDWKRVSDKPFDWYGFALLYAMHALEVCDAIYMLRDWKDSPGATAEHAFATATGKRILYEEEKDLDISK